MDDPSEVLRDEYRMRFSATAKYRDGVWKALCEAFFGQFIPPAAHVLDLGSGWGEFLRNVSAAKKYAMDLNPDAGVHLDRDAVFLHQDCSQEWQLPSASLDVVFTSNFLEHLPDKAHVERAIRQAHRCLRPGGLILCLGPNIKHVNGAYWDFWDHHVPITDLSLSELLKMQGFSIQRRVPRFLPYSMSTGRTPPLPLVRWYLKLPIVWPLFGKQFLVVGRKEDVAQPL
jgi:SAM-dependent methyltransferase